MAPPATGRAALHAAVKAQDGAAVQAMLANVAAQDFDLDELDEGGAAALYSAVRGGDVEVTRALLQHGADVNLPTRGGSTPLCRAAQHGATVSAAPFGVFFPSVLKEACRTGDARAAAGGPERRGGLGAKRRENAAVRRGAARPRAGRADAAGARRGRGPDHPSIQAEDGPPALERS